jgi:ubiquinone/menaquinone biosynthesis C-methylase UbiE
VSDTFVNSCEHWSEKHLSEMKNFYNLAYVDYHYLAKCIDWKDKFETLQKKIGNRSIKLLDVACGSGKFPDALLSNVDLNSSTLKLVDYSLLDPSKFSILQAKNVLRKPFVESLSFESTLQDFKFEKKYFSIFSIDK